MTLQQLEYIIALDNHRNFIKAAESCYVTQPTLTMQVQKLEEETGIRLFKRSKPLKPTKAGESFILKARQIIREVAELKSIVYHETDSMKGVFHLGIIPTLAPSLLPLFLKDFLPEFPETKLYIREMQSENIIEALKSDQLDLAILATPLEENQLREINLFEETFLAYFPENHRLLQNEKVKTDDLELSDLLYLSEGHCFRNQALSLCTNDQIGINKGFEYQSGSIETIIRMVDKGMGYTLVPELSIIQEPDKNPRIRRFESPEPGREISLVVHKSFSREQLIENLRKSVLTNIPEHFIKNERSFRVKWR